MNGRLILTRKKDEEIILHYDGRVICTLSVHEIRGDRVRISFQAESDLIVDRVEVYEKRIEPGSMLEDPGPKESSPTEL